MKYVQIFKTMSTDSRTWRTFNTIQRHHIQRLGTCPICCLHWKINLHFHIHIFGAKIWDNFVRCEKFACLIAWLARWRVASKIHLNSLSQGPPTAPNSATVSTIQSVLKSIFLLRMGLGPAEPAVSALPVYKWAILITILQAGPRAGKLAAVRTDQTSHLLTPKLFTRTTVFQASSKTYHQRWMQIADPRIRRVRENFSWPLPQSYRIWFSRKYSLLKMIAELFPE